MYYDDQARRFNFLSGLVFGAVLGTGLALLSVPQIRVRGRGSPGRRLGAGLERVREGARERLTAALAAGRGSLGR